MVRVFRWLSLILVLSPLLLFAFGILFWASAARPEGFFVFEAIRARSIVSFWLYDKSEKDFSKQIDMSVFVWIRPSQIGSAFTSFDEWFQEYLLMIEDTDEAADGAPYILPPAIIPPFQIESSFEL